jgi:hypothetical protein
MGLLKGNTESGWLKTRQKVAFINDALQGKNTESIVVIQGTPGSLAVAGGADGCELAQGVLKVSFARLAGQEFLTADSSNLPGDWGGAPDMVMRIEGYNYALSTVSYGFLQALRVYAYSTSDGSLNQILGAEFSVYERSSYAAAGKGCETAVTVLVSQRCRGVIGTRSNLLVVDDRSDGSQHSGVQGTASLKCYNTAMIRLHSEGGASFAQRATAIHFGSAGTGTGWAHAFSFQTAAGVEGFVQIADGAHQGNVNGYIKVYDVATAQTLYILCYDAVPS